MSDTIYWEIYYIRDCFLWGVFLAIVYDVIRIFRIMFPHMAFITAIEDFIYWSGAAIGMFIILYLEDNGTVRWFAVAATFLAMLLMNICVSKYTVPFIGNLLAKPLRFMTKLVRSSIKKLKKVILKQLKSIRKQFTMAVKKRREEILKRKEQKRKELEGKRKELESKRKEHESKRKEHESKRKEHESKRKELESKKNEHELKKTKKISRKPNTEEV